MTNVCFFSMDLFKPTGVWLQKEHISFFFILLRTEKLEGAFSVSKPLPEVNPAHHHLTILLETAFTTPLACSSCLSSHYSSYPLISSKLHKPPTHPHSVPFLFTYYNFLLLLNTQGMLYLNTANCQTSASVVPLSPSHPTKVPSLYYGLSKAWWASKSHPKPHCLPDHPACIHLHQLRALIAFTN